MGVEKVCDENEINNSVSSPPKDTRANARIQCCDAFYQKGINARITNITWDYVLGIAYKRRYSDSEPREVGINFYLSNPFENDAQDMIKKTFKIFKRAETA